MRTLCFKVFLFLILSVSPILASDDPEGWMWYLEEEELSEEDERAHENNVKSGSSFSTPQDKAIKDLKKLQKEFEGKMARAVLNTTRENVEEVYHLQNKMVSNATSFQKMWQLVTLMNSQPLEDNPNPHVQKILKEEERKNLNQNLRYLSKSFGLFFMFKEECPYCHQFAPIVRRFSMEHGFQVKAISLNGGRLKDFPKSVPDNGVISLLNPEGIFPALFLVNPETRDVVPLSWGMTSLSGLHENAQKIIQFLRRRR